MINMSPFKRVRSLMMILGLVWILGLAGESMAQQQLNASPPMAYEPMPPVPEEEEPSAVWRAFQAVCWYLPNRLVDLTDIPRFYITFGDGMGASIRATSLLTATWFEDHARCLGWTKRTPPFFDEHIEEHYLGFLAAQAGDLDRDPTELGLSFHFILIGANAALSGIEAVDFLTGLVGIDVLGDDHGPTWVDYTEPDPIEQELQQIIYQEDQRVGPAPTEPMTPAPVGPIPPGSYSPSAQPGAAPPPAPPPVAPQ